MLAIALLLAPQPDSTAARAALIEQLLFDTCPKVIAGEINLADPAQLQPLSMRPSPRPHDRWTDADSGRGQARITIGYRDFGGLLRLASAEGPQEGLKRRGAPRASRCEKC